MPLACLLLAQIQLGNAQLDLNLDQSLIFENDALLSTDFRHKNKSCECSGAPCQSIESGDKCESARMVPRRDCPCCMVCTQLQDRPCKEPQMPCDSELGLTCSDAGKCTGNIFNFIFINT